MARPASNFFESLSVKSSDEKLEASQFSMAILEREVSAQIGEGLTCASCEAVISSSSVHSSSYRNYRWVAFWPKHGLKSDLRAPNFKNLIKFYKGQVRC